ncbi:MAG: dephospho-CoA kinase [Deltaproteobacteria bacterium]|nr:dephospho-CoA kinase [Deltaproteobacteria bacterium]
MQIIGLTGGIATGKSTVSAMLKKAGALIIDADRIARAVVKKGLPAYREIIDHFGSGVLLPDGEIDRNVLGDIIFNDPQKKQLLNRIVHPRVKKEVNRQLKQIETTHPKAVAILDIPLLIEAGMHRDLSEIIVVYAPQHIQVKRLMQRDRISESDALARVRSQMPIEEKKQQATIVIDNSGTIENTRRQTQDIFERLNDRSA